MWPIYTQPVMYTPTVHPVSWRLLWVAVTEGTGEIGRMPSVLHTPVYTESRCLYCPLCMLLLVNPSTIEGHCGTRLIPVASLASGKAGLLHACCQGVWYFPLWCTAKASDLLPTVCKAPLRTRFLYFRSSVGCFWLMAFDDRRVVLLYCFL